MINLKSADLKKIKTDALVIPVCEDQDIHADKIITSLIRRAEELKEFNGKKGEQVVFYNLADVKAVRTLFMGLGKGEKVDLETLRSTAGKAVKEGIKKTLSELMIVAPEAKKINMDTKDMLEALMEGACLGNHLFDRYKQERKHEPLKKVDLFVKPDDFKKYKSLAGRIETICRGTILAREWVTMPPNEKIPERFSRLIAGSARSEKVNVTVFGEKELKQKKFGALLAVAAGSQNKPKMVVLKYKPKGVRKTTLLVGKGVTFDSGGINLKPSAGLADMKCDMSGAAAVAATLITIARLKPKMGVVGIIPIVENMPSGKASRPGDIIKSFDGKTVEIGNTDAEGRLILIDAMAYGIKTFKPHTVIDLATLTGACMVALGEKIAGTFSFDDDLAEMIVASGDKTFERCWRMPLPDDYKDLLKSDLADISNMSSTRYGGAITAALFLSEFVGQNRWAHIDIAGPAYSQKGSTYCGAGGSGFGVRLLCDLLEKL